MGEEKNLNKGDGDGDATTETGMMRTRIFVGGLGWSVTEDDIQKTFSPLGIVESVEIIRTKGRSFAYLDFCPSSEKSLAKLFSMYNGCMWKGGKLKLEKAKEHYLVRMKSEWAEDVELANNAPESMQSSDKPSFDRPKKLSAVEKPQLHIFFPKLGKLKSVPFSGTGKHKYSFQRIEVPAFPLHFCDCEEHSDHFHMAKGELAKEEPSCDLETSSGGIKEEEINMMKSVMNKLFERENCPSTADSEAGWREKGDDSVGSIDDELVDADELDDDEDNLIINMVAGGQESFSLNQESTFHPRQTSKDKPAPKMHGGQRKKTEDYSKKRKSSFFEGSGGKEIPETKRIMQSNLSEPENQTPEPSASKKQSVGKFSWTQKSSWRNMVGERGSSSTPFHISQIMASVPSAKEEKRRSDELDVPHSTGKGNQHIANAGSAETKKRLGKRKSSFSEESDLKGIPETKNSLRNYLNEPEDQIPEPLVNKEQSTTKFSETQKSEQRDMVGERDSSTPFHIPQIIASVPSAKDELPTFDEIAMPHSTERENQIVNPGSQSGPLVKEHFEVPVAMPNAVLNKYARGAAWQQKSSWTQLVADVNSHSFSISQVLPGFPSENSDALNSGYSEHHNLLRSNRSEPTGDSLKVEGLANKVPVSDPNASNVLTSVKKVQNSTGPDAEQVSPEKELGTVSENNAIPIPTPPKPSAPKPTSVGDYGAGFVRSDASMKEWMKTKTALSNSLRKKDDKK